MAETDEELVQRILLDRRDQAAYRHLVDRHDRGVYNLAFRLIGNRTDAKDAAQESFVKAFDRLETFDLTRRFVPWLLRIVHNTAIDVLRRARPPAHSLELAESVATNDSGPVAAIEHAELRNLLERGLRDIRPAYRAALVLRYQEGLRYAEMALVMGVPEGTAKTYVHRGRRDLASALSAQGLGSPD